ncbi:hypothetical protein ACFU6M_30065 [Streptomyces bottropensis]|uniref:hypothetical protein n=1 Tax=Streptomyces bottropensis TaxID=42235 RepID=UPI0036A24C9C
MDYIAQAAGLTTPDRADRARGAWMVYAAAFDGTARLQDLIADLLHLANVDEVNGGAARTLEIAVDHYTAELPTWPETEAPSGGYHAEVSIHGREWQVVAHGDEPREVADQLSRSMQLVGFRHGEMHAHLDDLVAGHTLTAECGTAFRVRKATGHI